MSSLREAKASLNLDFLVMPQPATPSSPGCILVFGGECPPWICDHVHATNNLELTEVLGKVLIPEAFVATVHTVVDQLTSIMGFGVREIDDKEVGALFLQKNGFSGALDIADRKVKFT